MSPFLNTSIIMRQRKSKPTRLPVTPPPPSTHTPPLSKACGRHLGSMTKHLMANEQSISMCENEKR